jgi:hypothetical protein
LLCIGKNYKICRSHSWKEKRKPARATPETQGAELFESVRSVLNGSRGKAFAAKNLPMVESYWNIGKLIVKKQGDEERAAYGEEFIEGFSKQLTEEYGKWFTSANLWYMRLFYEAFPIRHALRDKFTWTHYRLITKVENPNARKFYLDECADSNWITRQFERQINTFCYERVLSSKHREITQKDVLKRELNAQVLDTVKDTLRFGLLGLKQNNDLLESDLEKGLIGTFESFCSNSGAVLRSNLGRNA